MERHPARQAYVEEGGDDEEMTYDLANVPVDTDYYMPSTDAGVAPEKASAILSQLDRKRKAAAIAVPTDDARVRARLRELGEPITLFGERPEDRRDRLRTLLYAQQEDAEGDVAMAEAEAEEEADDTNQEFYTTGVPELVSARQDIAKYSLPRAARRIQRQRLESQIPLKKHVDHRNMVKSHLSGFELFGSQIAGDRPVSIARFAPNTEQPIVAAGNWGGSIRLLDVPNLEEKALLRGHTAQVSGLSWYPGSTLPGTTVSPSTVNLASGGGEGNIHLWSLEQDTPISTLSGHNGRVCRVDFHPSGRYLASASYDTTWRLWDVETTTELVLQEGHSREVYNVAFNSDGALLASAGLDSIASIWDLRSGRRVLYFEGHIQPIHGLDWSVDGHRILTGSADGFAKCWDVRAMRETASIGAHKGGVTDIKWFKGTDGPMDVAIPEGEVDADSLEPKKSGTFL
ncbi:hypothetical protein H2203_003790 [Taxawa tesnikishii (nom. ined.)]|nr:hypothetical protein H2203_003790 [Dothideales sp. JES 119]